ncbi:hypothetical protein [Streptomyces sp. HB132]|uniref:hypothetical protein n=1 Tax=Streptomyces sp. HB132 TaxID=767388 RepID=UPI001960A969|nr:hypothetical protein [Streptomyces sp. HB132]MBM7437997.1 hypothetical protein [Streptomyces sp. HB132]
MGKNGLHQDFRVGDVLRVSCPPAQGRVVDVFPFDVAVEWPWAQIDPQSQFRWNGQRAFATDPDSPDWTTSLFKTDPEPWKLHAGDSCLVGMPETLVRITGIHRCEPPQDVGWLPRPHTMLGVVPADYPGEALSEDDVDTIYLDSAAPVTIELVSRG